MLEIGPNLATAIIGSVVAFSIGMAVSAYFIVKGVK